MLLSIYISFREYNSNIFNFFLTAPAEFDFAFYQKVNVIGTSQVGLLRDTSEIIVMRFKEDFTMVLATDADVAQLDQMVLQYIAMTHPNIVIIDSTISEGTVSLWFENGAFPFQNNQKD